MPAKLTQENAYEEYYKRNLTPLESYIDAKTKIKALNKDGYYVDISLQNVKMNKSGKVFSKDNRFILDNIKRYIDIDTNSEYEYVSGEFENAYSVFKIRHKKCNRIFESKWCNIHRTASEKEPNRHGTRCPFCEASQLESTHALVLKQVWLHEKPNGTRTEDMSCINPNTNHPLPTDIVNHNEKIAIEIQSWFHDFDDQITKDTIKKNYWINNGYKFYAIDQRDYTVLEMIQIFFPYIKEIPDYINFDYSNKINDIEIQKRINSGESIPNIAKDIGCKAHTIYDAIRYGRIQYPKNYIDKSWTQVVQCDKDNNLIKVYSSIAEAQRQTNTTCISDTLNHNRHFKNGYYWYRLKDYNENIAI